MCSMNTSWYNFPLVKLYLFCHTSGKNIRTRKLWWALHLHHDAVGVMAVCIQYNAMCFAVEDPWLESLIGLLQSTEIRMSERNNFHWTPQRQTTEVNHLCSKCLLLASHNQPLGTRGVLPVQCNHRTVSKHRKPGCALEAEYDRHIQDKLQLSSNSRKKEEERGVSCVALRDMFGLEVKIYTLKHLNPTCYTGLFSWLHHIWSTWKVGISSRIKQSSVCVWTKFGCTAWVCTDWPAGGCLRGWYSRWLSRKHSAHTPIRHNIVSTERWSE